MAKSLVDEFLEGVGNAVRDVREKVVEEGWFGRTVTDNIQASPEPAAQSPANEWPDYLKESLRQDKRDDPAPPEPGRDR